ncbi:MAG: VanZ family protein [Gammaproteobacteria bacterium]|nr:VanZ family protein [Gammaproteobacteria bacterium]MDH5693339.1 VanZ family protein [Gammaproteobacteria bacterium]
MPPIINNKKWLAFGWVWVALVWYVSLTPNPPDTSGVMWGDKWAHFATYAFLLLWFAQVYKGKGLLFTVLTLVAMGVLIEFIQGYTGYRSFDYYDMLANSIGVGLGLLLSFSRLGHVLELIRMKVN